VEYRGDIATVQRRVAETSDLYRRRLAVLDALCLQPGERVLEVGCGGGALLPALAASVGPTGRVVGTDISPDQIEAANSVCAGSEIARAEVQDVNELSYDDASFDAIAAIQVVEYLSEPRDALTELRRVCSRRGRVAILATNWDAVFWHCDAPELTARIQAAWREHAPHPNLPSELRSMFADTGLRVVRQAPVTIINGAYHEDAFAYWIARLMVAYVTGRRLVSGKDADRWLEQLQAAQDARRFFFTSTPVLTLGVPDWD
jgi:cyclopropane fatty-acyl-phospholipid synthase-like methyltransferase